MPIDVSMLVKQGEYISAQTTPTPGLLTGSETTDRAWAILSLLSSRRAFWETYVCVHGYAKETEQTAQDIIQSIRFDEVSAGLLKYCSQFSGQLSPREAITAALYIFRLVLADVPAVWSAASIEKLENCIKQYDHNWPRVWECMNR